MTLTTSVSRRAIAGLGAAALLWTMAPAHAGAQEVEDLVWQAITFGQSTDLSFSANVLPEKVGTNYADPDVPGTVQGEVFLESRGGKLTSGHDGLTFYYVDVDPNEHNFVLEADVTVHQLGPETGSNPNGQEGAGIMVRDLNGGARQDPMLPGFEEVVAASNIAAVSFMRAGPSTLARTGVIQPWGNLGTVWANQRLIPGSANNAAYQSLLGTPVHMRLERTDTAFLMSAGFTYNGQEIDATRELIGADWVQELDPDNMTLGLFASRNAAVTFTNVTLTLSEADTQPRPVVPTPPTPVAFDITSPQHYGSTKYPFSAAANYDGTLTLTANGQTILTDAPVTAGRAVSTALKLPVGASTITASYTPSDPDAPTTEPITRTQTVDVREFKGTGKTLVSSPDASVDGAGTTSSPVDLATAVRYLLPGQTLELLGGTYLPSQPIVIGKPYSGTTKAPKYLRPAKGAEVTLDGQNTLAQVIRLDGDHWRISGLHLTRAASNGIRVAGNHNKLTDLLANFNGNTGIQLSGSVATDPTTWPSHNLVLNCESHDNRDAADQDADGFAAKLGVGAGNVFRGNIAHHNIDDGWDLYNRISEGANEPITLEGNIAYSNGKLSDGYLEDGDTGVGFKLGGEGIPVAHVVTGNLAFDNNSDGFSDNFNPGRLEVRNNTSIDNKRFNFIFRINPYFPPAEQGVFRNNLSLRTGSISPDLPDYVSGDVDGTNFFYDGSATRNSQGRTVTAQEFVSLTAPESYSRTKHGDIVWGTFTQPKKSSFLAKAGTRRTHVGAVAPARSSKG